MNIDQESFEDVTENGEWLEDKGCCSHYATNIEESVWVCHNCQEVIDEDPIEHECELREFWD